MKNEVFKRCPICGEAIEIYYESTEKEPFKHKDPVVGLTIYGTYEMPKKTICFNGKFLHFHLFGDNRLVKLGSDVNIMGDQKIRDFFDEDFFDIEELRKRVSGESDHETGELKVFGDVEFLLNEN